jgi:ABC-2 type transport system ATP-binding protein
LICGALLPDSGDVSVAGYDIRRQADEAHAHLGYLSQRFSLYEDLTVLENIRFFAEVRGLKSDAWYPRCMEILEFVGLAQFKDRFAGMLSGGMKQKLGLATALVVQPQVFLFDEPTTGVDPLTRQDFWQLIIHLVSARQDGADAVGVLISTPYMDEAARCNRIGFMRSGQIIAEGTPSELRSMLDGRIVEMRGSPLPLVRKVVARHPQVQDVRAFGDSLHIRLREKGTRNVLAELGKDVPAAGGTCQPAREVAPMLEDVFIALSNQEEGKV